MFSIEQIDKLREIHKYFLEGDYVLAEVIFTQMCIVDTPLHLSLPSDLRHLIWNLYEFLIIGDKKNVTDRQAVLDGFDKLFSIYLTATSKRN
jgi:hypothetical protein